jgi:hypothetical protein
MVYSARMKLDHLRELSSHREERAELQSVLASKVFTRSPHLAQMLRYVCEKHWDGDHDRLKEYSIAVEALGRSADFDQTQDSIVRVEAHRLRKRLREYYQDEGAGNQVRIVIATGSYIPEFRPVSSFSPVPTSDVIGSASDGSLTALRQETGEDAENPAISPPVRTPSLLSSLSGVISRKGFLIWIGASLAIGLVLAVLAGLMLGKHGVRAMRSAAGHTAPATSDFSPTRSLGSETRILSGLNSGPISDSYGGTWQVDRYFKGGEGQVVQPKRIDFAGDSNLFRFRRLGSSAYNIPLQPGVYELRLYFAETSFGEDNPSGGGENSRRFTVRANGKDLLHDFDVLADAGGDDTADVKVFKDIQPAPDGVLHLEFVARIDQPFINAIELVPSKRGAINPIRIVSRDSPYVDAKGRVWSADRYVRGGRLIKHLEPVAGDEDQGLYQGERYGNFTFMIPVAQGSRYFLTLRFSEFYYGPGRPGGSGVGSRIFDVYLNGKALLTDLDVFKEVGSLRALTETFDGVKPNAQGMLVLNFVPKRDYAVVNAIEVVDEAWN